MLRKKWFLMLSAVGILTIGAAGFCVQAEENGTGTNEVETAGDTTDEGTKQNNREIIYL